MMSVAERPTAQKTITLEVFRYLPDQEEEPRFQSYEKMLQVVEGTAEIQRLVLGRELARMAAAL